jgi:hypothetical protein
MEIGQHQLQISVGLLVFAATCAALICDLRRRNSQRLRELRIDPSLGHDELAQPMQTPPKRLKTSAARTASPLAGGKRTLAPEALAAIERGAQLAGVASSQVPPTVGKRMDWNALLSHGTKTVRRVENPALPRIPSGFHEGSVLGQLVQTRQPVSGLVVSIGVSTPRNSDGSFPDAVRNLIRSLIGPADFACQSNEDEFLLVYPNERAASAQRRLSEIAQQLWEFQLDSAGAFSILFNWGGVEVRGQSIGEAIASAHERMHETRRGHKLLTPGPRSTEVAIRKAV